MKFVLMLITAFSVPCSALTCGLYQVDDFGIRIIYSITKFNGSPPRSQQTTYTVTNPGVDIVKGMVNGQCYCVQGPTQQDPEYLGDHNFQLLTVEAIEGLAFADCHPPYSR